MKFILFCEGWTEQGALPDFLRRWLNPKLPSKVGIQTVRFNGWSEIVKETPKKAKLHLANSDVIAVVALLDLYGPNFYPQDRVTTAEKFAWAKKYLEEKVGNPRFRQHFAVHELEAWLLSQPEILPAAVCKKLPGKISQPESINFNEPPALLLERLYEEATGRTYKKRTYGEDLFRKLNPEVVYNKCPYFRKLADDLIESARKALVPK